MTARAHVAAEHARVRTLVGELVQDALQTGRKVGHRRLRERLAVLRGAIEHAADVEERELVPLISTADAWGIARVDRIRERHKRLLQAVREFEDGVARDRHGPCDVVARAADLVAALAGELEEEESAVAPMQKGEDGDTVTVDQEDA